MPRTRRQIESMQTYEICFRARSGLPLVANQVIQMVIKHALARAQRDNKVVLCHDIWNGSHAHIIIVVKDAYQCVRFYGEVQKKITDCIKRLLGKQYLRIWEGRVSVIKIDDLEHAKRRIAYLYANPAQDDLETSITRFPGYSSYSDFKEAGHKGIDTAVEENVHHLKLTSLPTLPSPKLSMTQTRNIVRLLENRNKDLQLLQRQPNYWMKTFQIKESEVRTINISIEAELESREQKAAERREKLNKKVLGRNKLLNQPIMAAHTPKKRGRKIFYVGVSKERRIAYLNQFKAFCEKCSECYREWLRGNFSVEWPPGAFRPALPPNMNILTF